MSAAHYITNKGEAMREVLRRDGPCCKYCGKDPGRKTFTLDHVVPRSAGGSNLPPNLVFACPRCNRRKLSKPLSVFLSEINPRAGQQVVGNKMKLDPRLRADLKRANDARDFPTNTCPSSRHLHMIAEALIKGKPYPMLHEEPVHCGQSMLSVVTSLFELRTEHDKLLAASKGGQHE